MAYPTAILDSQHTEFNEYLILSSYINQWVWRLADQQRCDIGIAQYNNELLRGFSR